MTFTIKVVFLASTFSLVNWPVYREETELGLSNIFHISAALPLRRVCTFSKMLMQAEKGGTAAVSPWNDAWSPGTMEICPGSLAAAAAAAAAKLFQSCPTLCDPRDGSPTGSAVPGILQARTLEWVAISFSNA